MVSGQKLEFVSLHLQQQLGLLLLDMLAKADVIDIATTAARLVVIVHAS